MVQEGIQNQYDVNVKKAILVGIQNSIWNNEVDLIAINAFLQISLYEDMFAPSVAGRILLRDVYDWGSALPLLGEELLLLDLETPGVDEDTNPPPLKLPLFYVYNISQVESSIIPQGRQWVLDFSSWPHIVHNQHYTSHLHGLRSDHQIKENIDGGEDFFMGPVSELAEKIMTSEEGLDGFNQSWKHGSGQWFGWNQANSEIDHAPFIEKTSNNILYKPDQGAYRVLRKSTEEKSFSLLTQLAENSISERNPNVANFVFYQDLDRWNFRSIDSLLGTYEDSEDPFKGEGKGEGKEEEESEFFPIEPVKTYCGGMQTQGGYSSLCPNKKDRIIGEIKVIRQSNNFDNAQDGMFASTMSFYKPKIDTQNNPFWFANNIDYVYYRVNCRYKDHFPAALIGFEAMNESIDTDQYKNKWRYGFAEVYLVFNYGHHVGLGSRGFPEWRIKPISQGGVRSWVSFKEDGPHWIMGDNNDEEYDIFARNAFNNMEWGNEGAGNYDTPGQDNYRQGWEAPGVRIDTEVWEQSCFKLQPIRGSMDRDQRGIENDYVDATYNVGEFNNVVRHVPTELPGDGDAIAGDHLYPIVDMKMYWDQENEAHYFFSASNAVDGECTEVDYESENSTCDGEPTPAGDGEEPLE